MMRRLYFLVIMIMLIAPVQGYTHDYNVKLLDDTQTSLGLLTSKDYLLIDAMATWCEPCKIEMVHLYEVQQNVGDKVDIFSVSVDLDDSVSGIESFVRGVEENNDFDINWTFGFDYKGEITEAFNIGNIPTLILLNAEGELVKSWVGLTETQDIIAEIDPNYSYEESGNPVFDALRDNILIQGFVVFFGVFFLAKVLSSIFVKKGNV
ncbi:MAG: TlpA family protein disulfide reductase [Candidatus Heimdallarchaeota archaeon]|nr:TlpA family protein disulfide reductase [Candidatus Heimdallarchaeota archaeon]